MEAKEYQVKVWTKILLILSAIVSAVSVFLSYGYYAGTDWNGEAYNTAINNGESLISQDAGVGGVVLAVAVITVLFSVLTIILKKRGLNIATNILALIGSLVLAGVGAFVAFYVMNLTNGLGDPARLGIGSIMLFVGAGLMFVFSIVSMAVKGRR